MLLQHLHSRHPWRSRPLLRDRANRTVGAPPEARFAGRAGERSCTTCTSAIHGGRARSNKNLPVLLVQTDPFQFPQTLLVKLADLHQQLVGSSIDIAAELGDLSAEFLSNGVGFGAEVWEKPAGQMQLCQSRLFK